MIKTINKKIIELGQGDVYSHFEIRNNGSKKIGIMGLDATIKGEIGTSPNKDGKDIFDREIVFMFNNSKSIDVLIKDLQWLKERMSEEKNELENENSDNKKGFTIRCNHCESTNVIIREDIDYDYEENPCMVGHYLECKDCGEIEDI